MFIITICKIIVIVLYSVEVILVCDCYVTCDYVRGVTSAGKYELLGRGSKSYQAYIWMTGV